MSGTTATEGSGGRSRLGRRRWMAIAAVAVVALGVAWVVASSGDDPDPFAVFCGDATAERDGLAGTAPERAAALSRLTESAPDELAGLVEEAAVPADEALPDDLFVVPGDANSAVRADVAAEVWGEQASASQAWSRVEQVLVGECGLGLDSTGGGS